MENLTKTQLQNFLNFLDFGILNFSSIVDAEVG